MLHIAIFFSVIYIIKVLFTNEKPVKAKPRKPSRYDHYIQPDRYNKKYYNKCLRLVKRESRKERFLNLFK